MNEPMKFEDAVKAKLKSVVADLIPEERWEAIVSSTVREFEQKDLPVLVKQALSEQYAKLIAQELSNPEWRTRWDQQGNALAGTAVSQLIIDAAPAVLASLIGGAVQNAVNQLQYSMQTFR